MVTVEIRNEKAMNLLKELEDLDIIKIHATIKKERSGSKAEKYRGRLSKATADNLLKHVAENRNEWKKRFPTK